MPARQVFLDIAIGDTTKHAQETERYNKARHWVKQWATTYGLATDDLDSLEEQDRETVRDILSSDPTAQQENWLVDTPKPLGGGRLVFDLNDASCPKACDNFYALCQGGKIGKASKKPLHYKSTHLFRLVPNFMVQGGDITRDDGSGGDSIYNGKFNDEKAGLMKFTKTGQLAMANSGKNTNTSQFFITLKDRDDNTKAFDKIGGKYVIFGQLASGSQVLDEINSIPVTNETPSIDITIVECGAVIMTIGKPQVNHDIIAIAAALGDTYGIGYQQDLPWSIPGDWEWFQRITTKPYKNQQQQELISTDIIDNLITTSEPYNFEKDSDWHNIVIMGRLSWESIPMQQRPHHNRYNIVVSTQKTYNVHAVETWEHATVVNSIQDAMTLALQLKKTQGRIFVLGGEQIYRQLIGPGMPHQCTHILLTHIHYPGTNDNDDKIECDTFFPSIDPARFRTASHQELQHFVEETVPAGLQHHEPFQYEFRLYVRH